MRKSHVALLLLVVALVAVGGCANKTQSRGPSAPFTESTVTTSPTTMTPGSTVASNTARTYRVMLMPLNNSGVSGTATVTVNGRDITVEVMADGLEPNKKHEQHIHGFRDGSPSMLPPKNASVDDTQAEKSVGPPLLALEPTPMSDSNGRIRFRQTFTDVQMIFPLDIRAIELHGMTQGGEYDFELPVAAGLLRPFMHGSSTQPGMGGGTRGGMGGSGEGTEGTGGGTGGGTGSMGGRGTTRTPGGSTNTTP